MIPKEECCKEAFRMEARVRNLNVEVDRLRRELHLAKKGAGCPSLMGCVYTVPPDLERE